MICQKCGATMLHEPGTSNYYCFPCSESARAAKPQSAHHPPVTGDPLWAALRQLQERLAKVESAVLDLRRRLETDDERRLRKIRESLTEQGLLPNSAADAAKAHRFLDPEGNEEPSREEPGRRGKHG